MNQEYGKVSVSKAICLPGDLRLKTERELHGSIPGQMLLNKTAETLPATKKRFQTAPASNRSSHYTLPSKSHMGTVCPGPSVLSPVLNLPEEMSAGFMQIL